MGCLKGCPLQQLAPCLVDTPGHFTGPWCAVYRMHCHGAMLRAHVWPWAPPLLGSHDRVTFVPGSLDAFTARTARFCMQHLHLDTFDEVTACSMPGCGQR
jgi:hypothetical protein